MGCKGSKLEQQEAVALCRGRADLLAAAVRHRYALAEAHDALADSLSSLSASFHLLLAPPAGSGAGSAAATLALPTTRKEADAAVVSPPHSSSHINFAPSSGSESGSVSSSPARRVAGHELLHQHPHPSALPFPHYGYGYGYAPEPPFMYPPGSLQLYYARSRPPPASVAVEQRVAMPERVYFGSFQPAQYDPSGGEPRRADRVAAPPPSPPRASSWDFFNVFDNYEVYDNYCYDAPGTGATTPAPYTPSRSSREVREDEGIPDLEEDDAVVKAVSSEYSAPGSGARSRRSSIGGVSSSIAEVDEEENPVVDKGVVSGGGMARQQTPAHGNVAASVPTPRRVAEGEDIAGEIKAQFIRAADAVRELAAILEVGRRSYHPRSTVYHVSSRMVSAIVLPHSGYGGGDLLDVGGVEKVVGGRSLSLTLQKLYIWEKKLYDEVKSEEKMRLLLAKNSKRLKFLDQKGAEAHKIDATRSLVRKLSTKIRIAMRVIAKQEETVDGVPPYSPGRVGAPLVFVICNSWSQVMDRISEKEVVTTMQALVSSVRSLWEQQNVEQSEQLIAIREREKWSKILERKTLEINKEADTLNRKLALLPGRQSLLPTAQTYQVHFLEANSVQVSLRRVLEALESYSSSSLRAFEETLRNAEEERLSRERAKVS
ncbi:hypothetical protein ABZP36_033147 [Zizania latifolia]